MALTAGQATKLAAIAAALMAAIGAGVALTGGGSEGDAVRAALGDAGLSSFAGSNRTTDLLTDVLQPGQSATVSVTLPFSARVNGAIVGPPLFTISPVAYVDRGKAGSNAYDEGTAVTVIVTNNAPIARRFIGFINFDVP